MIMTNQLPCANQCLFTEDYPPTFHPFVCDNLSAIVVFIVPAPKCYLPVVSLSDHAAYWLY